MAQDVDNLLLLPVVARHGSYWGPGQRHATDRVPQDCGIGEICGRSLVRSGELWNPRTGRSSLPGEDIELALGSLSLDRAGRSLCAVCAGSRRGLRRRGHGRGHAPAERHPLRESAGNDQPPPAGPEPTWSASILRWWSASRLPK